jgi:hypothetical protein
VSLELRLAIEDAATGARASAALRVGLALRDVALEAEGRRALDLPYISATSRLCLSYISAMSPLDLPYICPRLALDVAGLGDLQLRQLRRNCTWRQLLAGALLALGARATLDSLVVDGGAPAWGLG